MFRKRDLIDNGEGGMKYGHVQRIPGKPYGMTESKTRKILQYLYNQINSSAEWHSLTNPNTHKDWLTYRHSLQMMQNWEQMACTNQTHADICLFHHTRIPTNRPDLIHTCTEDDKDIIEHYHIPIGGAYAIIPYPMRYLVWGDEVSKMPHAPQSHKKQLTMAIRPMAYKAGYNNSPLACMACLYVSKDPECYDKAIVKKYICRCFDDIGQFNYMSYYVKERDLYICHPVQRVESADWQFVSLFLCPTSKTTIY